MSLDYINEAFKSLESINEDLFTTDYEGIRGLSDFMGSDVDEKISIIDMDAETEDDLQDSYIGKIICDCNVCHSHVFKSRDEITIDDDGVVDIEDDCPMCGEHNGFVIIGEIKEFDPNAEEKSVTEEPAEKAAEGSAEKAADEQPEDAETEKDEALEESINESPRKFKPHTMKLLKMIGSDLVNDAVEEKLEESFNNVSIETDDQKMTMTSDDSGKVTVTTEPIQEEAAAEEVIAPVSDELSDEIINSATEDENPDSEIAAEGVSEDEGSPEDSELDLDIDEVDEESIDELGESYLKRVYENVDSFKTSNVSTASNKLIIEGIITFKSGAKKNTGFIFESADATKDGKLRFIGENAHFSRGKKAFTLNGVLDNKKLIVESFTYNYRATNGAGKSTRVYGTISRNK